MLDGWAILLVSLGYIGLLFAIAYYGDRQAERGRSLIRNPYVYALSLAVYCTAWTFYGSVGRAAQTGIGFLPIYLGPTLLAALWWTILRKVIRICKTNRLTSIADFIGSRYGKSAPLAGLVTVIAVFGVIPYISLQLKAVAISFNVLWKYPDIAAANQSHTIPLFNDNAFYIALLLAVFAILFGTRHIDTTEHHEGLVVAIAFESVVKLIAFLAVGIFITYNLYHGFSGVFTQARTVPQLSTLFTMQESYTDWFSLITLSMMAILFLPRQFQMAVVENGDEEHLNKAVWLFPLYLLAINLFVLPIAFGGILHFPQGNVDPDTFVLAVPLAEGQYWLALLVFIGGLSAATSMVIVDTVALTTMVSNDLIIPALLRWPRFGLAQRSDLSGVILTVRRLAIIVILILGYLYFRFTGETLSLVSIGLISFAAVAQFAPAFLGGMYWKGGTNRGAFVGLIAGFIVWAYTLPLPSLVEAAGLPRAFIDQGLFGLSLLKPYELLGLTGLNPITNALFWSMLVNVGGYVGVSLLGQPTALEHSQAIVFVDAFKPGEGSEGGRFWRGRASVSALQSLLGRFLGDGPYATIFHDYSQRHGPQADASLVNYVEKQLSGAIGAASARVMVASVVNEEPLSMSEVMNILDETSQAIAYSRQLEEKSAELEAATAELRAANERLRELDRLKDDFMSTVTHELRTPLTSIRAFAEILSDNPDLSAEQRQQFTHIILKESERLTRLINNVLDLAKMEAGKMAWQITAVDLHGAVQEALRTTETLFREKKIHLEVNEPHALPLVMIDRDRIIQVLLNLLANAIKFCAPEQGQVKICLGVDKRQVRLDISDNGPGIAVKDQEAIFEKFHQVGDMLTAKPQGTGLGLPICRQIISHFGGRLWVESQPGYGATFSFALPYVPDDVTDSKEHE